MRTMNPANRSTRKFLLGSTVLALLVMAGILVLASLREVPSIRPIPQGRGSSDEAEAMGSASVETEVPSNVASLTETDRQPVTGAREKTGSTSLLLTFVDGATGEPVPRLLAGR